MPYKTIQNSTWSNGQIKKSTFWPYPVRVLVLIAVNWIFKLLWLLIHHSNMLYLFLSLLDLKFMILHLFQIFFVFFCFCFCFDTWIEAGQNTVSTPTFYVHIMQAWLSRFLSTQLFMVWQTWIWYRPIHDLIESLGWIYRKASLQNRIDAYGT